MPEMYPEKYAQVSQMIDELAEATGLYPKAQDFVNDQVARKKEYGERMFMSPKQIKWLEDLHAEFVGTAEPQEPKGLDEKFPTDDEFRNARRPRDMDDDIPF